MTLILRRFLFGRNGSGGLAVALSRLGLDPGRERWQLARLRADEQSGAVEEHRRRPLGELGLGVFEKEGLGDLAVLADQHMQQVGALEEREEAGVVGEGLPRFQARLALAEEQEQDAGVAELRPDEGVADRATGLGPGATEVAATAAVPDHETGDRREGRHRDHREEEQLLHTNS